MASSKEYLNFILDQLSGLNGISYRDDGSCFVGNLKPIEHLGAYDSNPVLQNDWDRIMSYRPNMVYFAHRPEKKL